MCEYGKRRPLAGHFRMALLALMAGTAGAAQAAPDPSVVEARRLLDAASEGDLAGLAEALPRLPAPWSDLARARLAAGALKEAQAIEDAKAFLAGRDQADCDNLRAHAVIADAAFASARYAVAASSAHKRLQLLGRCRGSETEIEGATTMEGLAARLATAPTQRTVAFAPVAATYARDKVGLQRAQVEINGLAQEAVLDTGANLSVVSASTASRLGLRVLGDASVGSSSRAVVPTQVAIAEQLSFAGLVLENVAFLVLDDEQLEMPIPGGYRIDAIIGFPVFRAMRRVRFGRDGSLVPEPGAGDDGATGNLALAGSDLFVDARVAGIPAALHLDSGGSASSLSSSFSRDNPEALHGRAKSRQRLAGAGGATEREIATWPQARIDVAGRTVVLPALAMAVGESADAPARGDGVLGSDVLNQFDSWTLDLDRMRLDLGDPLKE